MSRKVSTKKRRVNQRPQKGPVPALIVNCRRDFMSRKVIAKKASGKPTPTERTCTGINSQL